jgi:hypothetical protein
VVLKRESDEIKPSALYTDRQDPFPGGQRKSSGSVLRYEKKLRLELCKAQR